MRRIAKYYVVVYLVRKDAYTMRLAYIQQQLQLISLPYSTHEVMGRGENNAVFGYLSFEISRSMEHRPPRFIRSLQRSLRPLFFTALRKG